MLKLGLTGKDKITGFEGVLTAKVEYLTGCTQYCLTPKAVDNKLLDGSYFDEGRIEITGECVTKESIQAPANGGPQRDSPRVRA